LKKVVNLLLIVIIGFIAEALQASSCEKNEFRITGLVQTDESWFRDYLGLEETDARNDLDLSAIASKILTSDIFVSAEVRPLNGTCIIEIDVKEKWTKIPVIRGAYGGGTPLLILGGYETNAFGKLLAIGGEIRRYGNMAPGAFLFFKSPRAWRGRGSWGGELWFDRRRRSFFDKNSVMYGYADSESLTFKSQILVPESDDVTSHFQIGLQLQGNHEKKTTFHLYPDSNSDSQDAPHDLRFSDQVSNGGQLAPMVAYDDLKVYGINASGTKARAAVGAVRSSGKAGTFAESELFWYFLPDNDVNFAAHLFAGTTSQDTVGGVYYLGGFDAVRGLPDGFRYGNKMLYGNFEARMIAARFKYANIQPAVFFDSGSAWMNDHNPLSFRESSAGFGVRIAVPQIYRFVVRIDYGRSIGATKSSGFSIGMNQFFQPYKMSF
jgi:outer membrane protein assembly factor BamA